MVGDEPGVHGGGWAHERAKAQAPAVHAGIDTLEVEPAPAGTVVEPNVPARETLIPNQQIATLAGLDELFGEVRFKP